ncbi:MAG: hypothetical protein Q4B27_01335 [Candidatus Saccharibacteria bacterium]|nr:hypothetical protein [Candidatus Saccharibacteria bacterium]
MAKGHEATGTSTLDPVLETGSATRAGVRGVVNHMIGAAKRIPDVYTRNVETQKAVNEQLGESGPMAGLDRRLRDFQTTQQEQRLARQTSPEANKNTVRKTLVVVGETIRAGLDSFGVGTIGEEYSEPKTTEQKISPAPPTEEDYAWDKAQREAETQQNQPSTPEQTSPTEQEQYAGEEATLARLQTEVTALTNEKVQEISTAESATDAAFAKGMADIAVQSKIAHEVILPYSAEGIAQLEAMRSDALATLQQAFDARNQGAKPTATPNQELAQSVAHAEHTPVPVSTSEQTPQAPAGFEAQVNELTDHTAQEIMASHSTMDAIRMKGEAASVVLSMTARELMQPHLSREDAAQLKDTRDRSLAVLQAALDVRLESPDSHQAASVTVESQPLAEATQISGATTAEPTHEEADGSVEENRAASIEAAEGVGEKKKDRLIRRTQTAQHMARKAIRAVKDWFSQKVPDSKPTPNRPLKDHSFTKMSSDEAHKQPVAVDTEAQATQPHTPSQEMPVANTEDPFALAEAAGVITGNSNPDEVVVTTPDEATHRGEDEPEELAEVIDLLSVVAGTQQEPHTDVEAPTEELETVAEAINTQEDAPLSRDEMRQMEQTARSKIQLGEYDLWAEITKADLNGAEVDIDELIKNTRTAIQLNMRGWLQEEGRQHQVSGLYLSTLEVRTMESADSALESIKQAYLKTKQARESRQDSAA